MMLGVNSEVAPLEAVVVNPPMDEFDRMVPANLSAYLELPDGTRQPSPDYLMFDDLVLLERMQIEHRQLREVLGAATGPRGVHTVRGMVAASLSEAPIRAEVVGQVVALEQELYGLSETSAAHLETELSALNAMRLTDTLFTGVERYSQRQLLRWPIPNALFARDLGAMMGDAWVLTYAARAGRRRDMLLARFVARHHPLFEHTTRIDIAEDGPVRSADGTPIATLEGGDLQVLSDRVAVVGCGIRTTAEASRRLAARLLERGFEAVVRVDLPHRRAAMHLDTLFTQVDTGHCLIFPPMVQAPEDQNVAIRVIRSDGEFEAGRDLLATLRDVGVALEPIWCGGADPIAQRREQWSDGANAFALAPGVIVTYARNTRTLRELGTFGFRTVPCEEFVRNATFYLRGHERVAVAIDGTELVRGRGGPRCLTMPLCRRPLPAS